MRDSPSPFFAYRYLIAPINNQFSLFHLTYKPKEELIYDIFDEINTNHKTSWYKGQKKYLLYGYQKDTNLFIFKFARVSKENIYLEGENDIEIQDIKEAKFVFVMIDTVHQIILIERNQTIFRNVESAKMVIEDFLKNSMKNFEYSVNVYPLVSDKVFWNYVDTADEIFELSLTLNAPNLGEGDKETRDILKIIKEATNNETLDISIKNTDGKLKVVRTFLGSWIDYILEIGGKYRLKIKKDGVTDTKTSETDTSKVHINVKKVEKYTENEIENIKEKTKKIHKLEGRNQLEQDEKTQANI